jgi:predicted nucleic acid-binding protein
MSWLLDTDVICQPAKKSGDAKVIAWLEAEQDRCYTSAVVIAQLAYWVRTKEGRQRQALQAWLTRLVDALHGRIHGSTCRSPTSGRSRNDSSIGPVGACQSRTVTSPQPRAGTGLRSPQGMTETSSDLG